LKKVLITGALGQDGQILTDIYIKKKFKVFGIIKKNKKKQKKNVKYFRSNLISKKNIYKIINNIKPDIIIHLAASNNSYFIRKKETYSESYKKNILISKNLIDVCVNLKLDCKFIFAGSSLMFGKHSEKIVNENFPFESNEYYGKYKIKIHQYLERLNKLKKINYTTVILFNHDSNYRNKKFLIPRIINAFKAKNKKFIKKIYSLNISGDFSSAFDICYGIYKLSISNKQINKIILSSGKRFYLNRFIEFIDKKYKTNFINNKIVFKENKNFLGSNLLAKKIINFKTKRDYLIFLKNMIQTKY